MSEFNLSEKIEKLNKESDIIFIEDVKEFIRKERYILDLWMSKIRRNKEGEKVIEPEDLFILSRKLNRLAGDKLI